MLLSQDHLIVKYLIDTRYRTSRHVVLLVALLVLLLCDSNMAELQWPYGLYFVIVIWFLFVGMFYINMYLLVPAFFFRGHYVKYLVLVFLLVSVSILTAAYFVELYWAPYLLKEEALHLKRERNVLGGILICTPIILLTTTIKLFQRWVKDQASFSELQNLTLTMELNELKNQINPHFLFNMLNNVKALIRKNPAQATEVIMKLSDFLRYQLYENSNEKTSLTGEINFINNFLNLEQIRRDKLLIKVHYDTNYPLIKQVFIPPGLFITFVENAVKHSSSIVDENSYIEVDFYIEKGKLHFVCTNSMSDDIEFVKDERYSGLGLSNIKRRLDLLYPGRYILDIQEEDNQYTVTLIVPL